MTTYQPPQNILAAILQSRKQQGAGQPQAQTQGVDMSQPQSAGLPAPKAPIDPMSILNGYLGANTQQPINPQASQPSALAILTSQLVPGAQPPTNLFAQVTGLGNPNQSNGQNIGQYLANLFAGK